MKQAFSILVAVVLTAMLFPTSGQGQSVTIGSQVWMTKNLNVDKFRNGDPIPQAKSDAEWEAAGEKEQPAWCYYDNDSSKGAKFGKLYNWYAVNDPRGLAPKGWHIPTNAEWTILTDYLGGEEVAGGKMKSKEDWSNEGNATNSSGFSALPGGSRIPAGTFEKIGLEVIWWSTTVFGMEDLGDIIWHRILQSCCDDLFQSYSFYTSGSYVRCIKD